jgi:hypothetical protein
MITEKKTEPAVTSPEVNVQKTKDMENINIVCSKHGIINNGAFYIRYSTIQKDDKMTAFDNHNLFCIACLNELYMKFQQDGTIGKLSVSIENTEGGEAKDIPVEEADIEPKTTE